jgi:hypothetical protein
MWKCFGNSLLLDYNSKKAAIALDKEKTKDLIRLKHRFSKIHKSNALTNDHWREMSQILNVGMKGSVLRICYFTLFKKYKQLKNEGKTCETDFEFFQAFDDLYASKWLASSEITLKSEVQEEANVIIEEIPQDYIEMELEIPSEIELETEIFDEELEEIDELFIAKNFNEICKFCLKFENFEDLKEVDENPELIKKIEELFYENSIEKFDAKISDKICVNCVNQIETSHQFQSRYRESVGLLKQFSEKYVVSDVADCEEMTEEIIEETQVIGLDSVDYDAMIETSEPSDDEMFWDEPKEEQFLKPKNEKKLKTCEKCGKLVLDLRSHMVTHSENHPFICNYNGCNRAFPFKERLRRHIKTHLGVRNYSCPVCLKTFICSSSLAKHKAIHDKILKYECDVCQKKFYRQSTYKKHISSHGIGLKHFCSICNKGDFDGFYLS